MRKTFLMNKKIFKIHKLNGGEMMRQRSIARNPRMPSYVKESRQFSLAKSGKTSDAEIYSIG